MAIEIKIGSAAAVEEEEKPKFQGIEKCRIALLENPQFRESLQNSIKGFLGI